MNPRVAIRVIRDKDRKVPGIQAHVESATNPNRWSTAVRSWVVEFKERDRSESLPAFDNLFKDALSESAPAD